MKHDVLILAKYDHDIIQRAKINGTVEIIINDDIVNDKSLNSIIENTENPAIWISDVFVGTSQQFFEDWLFSKMLINPNFHWWGKSYTGAYTEKSSPGKTASFAKPITVPDFDSNVFLQEIENIKHLFTNRHGINTATWLSFTIHGASYNQHRVSEDQPPESFVWTPEACSLIPNITDYFKNLRMYDKYGLICIKLLKPSGYINLHIDEGFETLPVNIAINNPSECKMHMWDTDMTYNGIVDFDLTGAVQLNVNKYHYVHNQSDTDRYHIIVHDQYKS
jgi:hypothetical protein